MLNTETDWKLITTIITTIFAIITGTIKAHEYLNKVRQKILPPDSQAYDGFIKKTRELEKTLNRINHEINSRSSNHYEETEEYIKISKEIAIQLEDSLDLYLLSSKQNLHSHKIENIPSLIAMLDYIDSSIFNIYRPWENYKYHQQSQKLNNLDYYAEESAHAEYRAAVRVARVAISITLQQIQLYQTITKFLFSGTLTEANFVDFIAAHEKRVFRGQNNAQHEHYLLDL